MTSTVKPLWRVQIKVWDMGAWRDQGYAYGRGDTADDACRDAACRWGGRGVKAELVS